jgi:3-oxoacyl-[acyl-carrier-protein] synthase III
MFGFRFQHVRIDAFALNTPPFEVTSNEMEERIAPLYERLKIPFGTLEKLTAIKTRYFWKSDTMPSDVATVAASKALEKISFPREHISALFSCSVTRDYFEPATACLIHRNLGLGEVSLALDISNACIGFSDGLLMMGNLIESGIVKAGIVVSGESVSRLVDNNIALLRDNTDITRDELLQLLPTLTLGSGAVAYVLAHDSVSPQGHKFLGGAVRSATQYNDLCAGNADHAVADAGNLSALMRTESSKIIAAAGKLGGRLWPEASELLGWKRDDIDHIFCHQVGKQVNEAFYREMGLDMSKEFTIYQKHGNLVSAAVPTALALGAEEKPLKKGEKVLCTAFGSGLNCVFLGIEW